MAMLNGGYYPQEKLYEGWKIILCSQFHDILPGSSIGEVYEDADKDYAKVLKTGNEVLSGALELLKQKIDTSGEGLPIIVINTLSWHRTDIATIKVKLTGENFVILDNNGKQMQHQVLKSEGDYTEILFEVENVPPMGCAVYRLIEKRYCSTSNTELKDLKPVYRGNIL